MAGGALVTLSLLSEPPAGSLPPLAPETATPGMAPGSGQIVGAVEARVPGGLVDEGGAPQPSSVPQVLEPIVETSLPQADTASSEAPAVAVLTGDLVPPQIPGPDPQGAGADVPVVATPLAGAPPAPPLEEAPAVAVAPTGPPVEGEAPAAPELAQTGTAVVAPATLQDGPVAGVVPEAPVAATVPDPVEITENQAAERPTVQQESVADQVVVVPGGAAPVVPSALPEAQGAAEAAVVPDLGAPSIDELLPDTGAVAEPLPEVVEIVPDGAAPPGGEAAQAGEPLPEVVENLPEAAAPAGVDGGNAVAPRIALSGDAASLPGNTDAVRVIRPGTAVAEAEAPEAVVEAVPEDGPALLRFAADYDNPDGKPLMSVILIDDGRLGDGAVPAVLSVPFPVTVALDATAGGAAERMAAYRAAGVEVMALASLPEGALPSDAEVTLEAAFAALPEAIGLLDAGAGGLQSDRAVTEQAMARLATDGRGFVSASQGLNMAVRSAEAADVPAAVVYRDLDSEDQDARVIRRFLDQAAFRARQQSGVVMVARVRPDTLSALTLWGTANRAGQVTLAPVSAILTQ